MTKAQYLLWFEEVLQPTEPMFRRVPSDKLDFKLTATSFSLGQLLGHIPASISFMAKVIRHEELPLNSVREILVANRRQHSASVDAAVEKLQEASEALKQAVENLSEDQFQNTTLDTPQMKNVHYWRYCAFVLEHHLHHLMELHLTLKMLGIPVNTQTLYFG